MITIGKAVALLGKARAVIFGIYHTYVFLHSKSGVVLAAIYKNEGNNQWTGIKVLYFWNCGFWNICVNSIKANTWISKIGKMSHISCGVTASRFRISQLKISSKQHPSNTLYGLFSKIVFTFTYNSFSSVLCLFLYNHKGKRDKSKAHPSASKAFSYTHRPTQQPSLLRSTDSRFTPSS